MLPSDGCCRTSAARQAMICLRIGITSDAFGRSCGHPPAASSESTKTRLSSTRMAAPSKGGKFIARMKRSTWNNWW